MTTTNHQRSRLPPRPRRVRSFLSSYLRLGAAGACLFVLCTCGQAEPQLPCPQIADQMNKMVEEIEAGNDKIREHALDFAAACAQAKTTLAQQIRFKKLVADNADRCKAAFNGMFSLQMSIATASETTLAQSHVDACK